jgi:hypothetical protein
MYNYIHAAINSLIIQRTIKTRTQKILTIKELFKIKLIELRLFTTGVFEIDSHTRSILCIGGTELGIIIHH